MFNKKIRPIESYFDISLFESRIDLEKEKREMLFLALLFIENHLHNESKNGWINGLNSINDNVLRILCSNTSISDGNFICKFGDNFLPEDLGKFTVPDFLFELLSFEYTLKGDFHKYGQAFYINVITKIIGIIAQYSVCPNHIEFAKSIHKDILNKGDGFKAPHKLWWLVFGDLQIGGFKDNIIGKSSDQRIGLDMGNDNLNEIDISVSNLSIMAGEKLLFHIIDKAGDTFNLSCPHLIDYLESSFKRRSDNEGFNKLFGVNSEIEDINSDARNSLNNFEKYLFDYYGYLYMNGNIEGLSNFFREKDLKEQFIEAFNILAKKYKLSTISTKNLK